VVTKDSPRPVTETVARLAELVAARQMKLFAVIDQGAEARQAGLELRETVLVIFGNPARGRHLGRPRADQGVVPGPGRGHGPV